MESTTQAPSVPAYVFAVIPIEAAFLCFHLSVFVFILVQRLKGNNQLSHAFYTLFLMQCCSNYANYGLMWLDRCIYEYKAVPIMKGKLDVTYYFALAYSMYFQFFTQVAIACNRFTALSFPFRHNRLWRGRSFFVALSMVFTLPFLCAASRPLLAWANGGRWWSMWGWAEHYRLVLTVVVLTTVCLANGSMELWTFYAYHRMNATRRKANHEEYRLLVYATLELATLLLRTFYFFLLATNDGSNWQLIEVAVGYMRYVISVETFSSPIFLVVASTVVRSGYLKFYRLRKQESVSRTTMFSVTMSDLSKA